MNRDTIHSNHTPPERGGRNDRRGYNNAPTSVSTLKPTTHRYSHGSNTDKDGDDRRGFHHRIRTDRLESPYGNRGDHHSNGGEGGSGGRQQNRNMSGRSGGHRGGQNGERGRYRRDSYDSRDGSYGNAGPGSGERDGTGRGGEGGQGGKRRGRGDSFSRHDHDQRRGDTSRHRDDYYGRQDQNDDDHDRDENHHSKRRRLSEDRDGGREHHHRRRVSQRRSGSGRHPPMRKKKSEWPSAFEESGANYVFDSRSGLFYEAESDFFYDPKNKMYYSNEKKVYYRYNQNPENQHKSADESSHWEEVKPEEGTFSGPGANGSGGNGPAEGKDISQDLVVQALQGGSGIGGNKQEKKKINICIKKKFSGSANLKKKIVNDTAVATSEKALQEKEKKSLAERTRGADIEKWTQRAGEAKADENDSAIGRNSASSSRKVKMTKAGKPICFVCKRKFADLEKLKQHEQLSALHKQNLAKKKKLQELNGTKIAEYRDRAKERRFMYDADSNVVAPAIDPSIAEMGPSLDRARAVTKTETVAPDQSLGETNVGNQLLQKLGWKSGGSLGRRGEEKDLGFKAASTDMKNKLKQDWERIEQLSGKN